MQNTHLVDPSVSGRLPGWPDLTFAALAALVADGLSYRVAAVRLGVTRDSALGLSTLADVRYMDGNEFRHVYRQIGVHGFRGPEAEERAYQGFANAA